MLKEILGAIFGGGNSAVKNVSVNEAKDAVYNGNAQFIDVRSLGEYKSGHAKKALNLPLDNLQNSLTKLDKEQPVYVICQSGMRSMRGASILVNAGFTEVYNVSGGTSAWMSAGLPTER
ncbi:MAG TPA: rhodanese-like domain-containing protein [Pyrinomonadaceae bacterium]|nr:rhodanese-like domain-containing protein [Pyrinomonadaceae bacterium]